MHISHNPITTKDYSQCNDQNLLDDLSIQIWDINEIYDDFTWQLKKRMCKQTYTTEKSKQKGTKINQ